EGREPLPLRGTLLGLQMSENLLECGEDLFLGVVGFLLPRAVEGCAGEGGAKGHEDGADEFAQRGAGKDVAVADGEVGGAINQRVVVIVDLWIVAALGVQKDQRGGA